MNAEQAGELWADHEVVKIMKRTFFLTMARVLSSMLV
jgi:hypothetical protein